jgi:hypothetical protein
MTVELKMGVMLLIPGIGHGSQEALGVELEREDGRGLVRCCSELGLAKPKLVVYHRTEIPYQQATWDTYLVGSIANCKINAWKQPLTQAAHGKGGRSWDLRSRGHKTPPDFTSFPPQEGQAVTAPPC